MITARGRDAKSAGEENAEGGDTKAAPAVLACVALGMNAHHAEASFVKYLTR